MYLDWILSLDSIIIISQLKKQTNLHPQMIGRGKKHKATRKAYQQHQTTRTGTTSSSGSLTNAKLSSKGRFDDMQQWFLWGCESQSHTIHWRQPKQNVARGRAGRSRHSPGGTREADATGHLQPGCRSSSAHCEIPSVISHQLTSLKLFLCFPSQTTAWLLGHSRSHADE